VSVIRRGNGCGRDLAQVKIGGGKASSGFPSVGSGRLCAARERAVERIQSGKYSGAVHVIHVSNELAADVQAVTTPQHLEFIVEDLVPIQGMTGALPPQTL